MTMFPIQILFLKLYLKKKKETTHAQLNWDKFTQVSKNKIKFYLRERRKRSFKELTQVNLGASKSEICRAGQQAGDSGKGGCCNLEFGLHRATN